MKDTKQRGPLDDLALVLEERRMQGLPEPPDFAAQVNQAFINSQKSVAEQSLKASQAVEMPLPKRVKALETYSASSLYGVHLERPPLIINNLLPVGLTVLAAPPKTGKSYMALAMGTAVSTGTPFLGMGTRPGVVLYMDLESRQYRVQDRLQQLIAGAFPENLIITHDAERIDGGLLEQLEEECCVKHPGTSLVIIDTLARVKGGGRRAENAYEADSRIFGELQRFAQRHKLAVLVVHHLKKSGGHGDASDPLERISGSMGLSGVADAILLLERKRGEETATLSVISRDFDSQSFALRFDSGHWILESADSEAYKEECAYAQSAVARRVLALMQKTQPPVWKGSAQQLLDALQGVAIEPLGVYHARDVSAELDRIERMLYEREGISIRRSTVRGRRTITIGRAGNGLL